MVWFSTVALFSLAGCLPADSWFVERKLNIEIFFPLSWEPLQTAGTTLWQSTEIRTAVKFLRLFNFMQPGGLTYSSLLLKSSFPSGDRPLPWSTGYVLLTMLRLHLQQTKSMCLLGMGQWRKKREFLITNVLKCITLGGMKFDFFFTNAELAI